MAAYIPPIILSVPTSGSGATAPATHSFYTTRYKPPHQSRASSSDWVRNQNGTFKYRTDNGPGPLLWEPFVIVISDRFSNILGPATLQAARLEFLWRYTEGPMGFAAPEAVYRVDWSDAPLEYQLYDISDLKPGAGDKMHYGRVVNFEEA